jgi:hypothetical protein
MSKFRLLLFESHHSIEENPLHSRGISKCMKALRRIYIKPRFVLLPEICFLCKAYNKRTLSGALFWWF